MILYVPLKGGTLLIPSGPNHDPDRMHLFVILTDRCPSGNHRIVSVSSVGTRRAFDKTCLLSGGCHEIIRRDSFVDYSFTAIKAAQSLKDGVDNSEFVHKAPIDPHILTDICNGVIASRFTALKYKKYYQEVTS